MKIIVFLFKKDVVLHGNHIYLYFFNWIFSSWMAGWVVSTNCTSITNLWKLTRDGVCGVLLHDSGWGKKKKQRSVGGRKKKCSPKMVKDTCAVVVVCQLLRSLPGALLLCSSAKFISWSVVRLSQLMRVSAPVVVPLSAFTFNYKAEIQFGVLV